MKKVLFIASVPIFITSFLLPFAAYFRTRGWIVDAMASDIEKSPVCNEHFDHCWNVALSRNPLKITNLLKALVRIRQHVISQRYDIVHVHTPVAAFVVRFALRKLISRPKVIYTAHGFHFYPGGNIITNFIFKTLEKMAGRWTDQLIVINKHDEQAAKKLKIVPSSRLHYIPGIGIDTNIYNENTVTSKQIAFIRAELGLNDAEEFFLMVAEFTPQKRQKLAVLALSKLSAANIHLVFAGEGKNLNAVKQLANKLGLQHKVHFLGFRRDIPVLLKACSALLLLSKREGLPRCILEAMSLGKPVIGTDIRGTRDLLENGAGLLLPRATIETLIDAMAYILQYPSESKKIGEKGKEQVNQYELNHILIKIAEIYQA